MDKLCPKCNNVKPLTTEYFYPARPRVGHKTPGWQSYCKFCWKAINKANKGVRRDKKRVVLLKLP